MSSSNRIVTQEAWGRARQAIALPVYTLGLLLDYLSAALRRLAEVANCLAFIALLMLIVVLKSVMRIPDLEGIDDQRERLDQTGDDWPR